MPTKPNRYGMQNYVPAGYGDVSGEYGDNETGSNIHIQFKKFAKPKSEEIKENKTNSEIVKNKVEDNNFSDEDFDLLKEDKSYKEPEIVEEINNENNNHQEEKLEPKKEMKYPKNHKMIMSYSDQECHEFFDSLCEFQFDKNKIKELNSKEMHNLCIAKYNIDSGFYEKKQSKLYDKFVKELKEKDSDLYNLWFKFPKTIEDLQESIPKKKQFLEENLSINKNEKYSILLDKINNMSKSDEFDEMTKKFDKFQSKKEMDELFVNKYLSENDKYSQEAKDNAIWCKSMAEAQKLLGNEAKKTIQSIKEKYPNAIEAIGDYTSSYSYINEPLRKKKYYGSEYKQQKFVEAVKNMTLALDNSVSKKNIWLQRGVHNLDINGKDLANMSQSDYTNLIGTSFKDQGFVSCGTAKNSGFSNKQILMNIYAPKGTKMLYVPSISEYESENETIIQRGYSYKISKIYAEGGQIYIDCDVILGSDSQKYNDNELKSLSISQFSN